MSLLNGDSQLGEVEVGVADGFFDKGINDFGKLKGKILCKNLGLFCWRKILTIISF